MNGAVTGTVLLTADGKYDNQSRKYSDVWKTPCCFAGDNDELVVGTSNDRKIYIWSAPPRCQQGEEQTVGQPIRVLKEGMEYGDLHSVRYSVPNGLLASAGVGPVQLWSINTFN